jgi:hypothetical protein
VIAGFAVGGLFYSFSVSRLLPWLGVNGIRQEAGFAGERGCDHRARHSLRAFSADQAGLT